MRRLHILAGCLAISLVGCTVVRQRVPSFNVGAEVGGCDLTFYRLPPQVPYRALDGESVLTSWTNDHTFAEAILAKHACEKGANALVLTHEAPTRYGLEVSAIFIRTEPGGPAKTAP